MINETSPIDYSSYKWFACLQREPANPDAFKERDEDTEPIQFADGSLETVEPPENAETQQIEVNEDNDGETEPEQEPEDCAESTNDEEDDPLSVRFTAGLQRQNDEDEPPFLMFQVCLDTEQDTVNAILQLCDKLGIPRLEEWDVTDHFKLTPWYPCVNVRGMADE